MNHEYCVYKHTAPNGKVYIGITCQTPERRWRNGNGYYLNKHFSRAIQIFGWDSFKHEILFEKLSKEEACAKEVELIELYHSNDEKFGYNKSDGGEKPAHGFRHSDETRMKMSIVHAGRKNTAEHCANISKGKKGKPNGKEGKKGIDCSKAGIVRMIDSLSGETIKTFYGYYEMQRMTGYAQTPVKQCAAGVRKMAYGYKWSYEKRGKKDVVI